MKNKKLKDLVLKKTKLPVITMPFIDIPEIKSNVVDIHNKCFGCPNFGKYTACWCIIGSQNITF